MFRMLGRVCRMRVGQVSVMGCLVVVARLVMLRRLGVVVGRHAVMMGRRFMVIRCLL
jgi:hypothetical protein